MSQYGLIYIISNPKQGMNIFKVGKTSKTIDQRLKQLNSETGLIGQFKLYASFLVEDIDSTEKICHEKLDDYRIQDNREFFEIEYPEILEVIRETIGGDILKENIEINLTTKEADKLKDKKIKKEREFTGIIDNQDNFEDLINNKILNKKQKETGISEEKLKTNEFADKKRILFDKFIEQLKKDLQKYKHINFYKHPHVHVFAKKITSYDNGWDIVFSKKDTESIENSKKFNTLYESIVTSFSKGSPYNSEQKEYIKGAILEDNFLKQEYLPSRKKLSCDTNVFKIYFDVSNSAISFYHHKEPYRDKGYLEESKYFNHIYNYGKAFDKIRNFLAAEVAGEKYNWHYFNDFEDQDKSLEYAMSLADQ